MCIQNIVRLSHFLSVRYFTINSSLSRIYAKCQVSPSWDLNKNSMGWWNRLSTLHSFEKYNKLYHKSKYLKQLRLTSKNIEWIYQMIQKSRNLFVFHKLMISFRNCLITTKHWISFYLRKRIFNINYCFYTWIVLFVSRIWNRCTFCYLSLPATILQANRSLETFTFTIIA